MSDDRHPDGLPSATRVNAECEPIGFDGELTEIYECSDEAVGCDVDEWYPELEYGYYIIDAEFWEVLDHTTELNLARAYALGFEKSRGNDQPVPLFVRSHTPRLEEET